MEKNTQAYVDLELTNQKLKELDAQLEQIELKLEQSILAKNMLSALQKAKSGDELLIPIGSGVFITTKADNVQEVKQAIGAGVVVSKTIEESLSTVDKQQKQLLTQQQQFSSLYEETVSKAMQLQSQIESTQ